MIEMNRVWLLIGDTYESTTTHAIFEFKPQREQVIRFVIDHYKGDRVSYEGTDDEVLSADYTIRCHTHDMKYGWISKERDFDQFIDDILEGIDGNDGDDYGTYFDLREMDLLSVPKS